MAPNRSLSAFLIASGAAVFLASSAPAVRAETKRQTLVSWEEQLEGENPRHGTAMISYERPFEPRPQAATAGMLRQYQIEEQALALPPTPPVHNVIIIPDTFEPLPSQPRRKK